MTEQKKTLSLICNESLIYERHQFMFHAPEPDERVGALNLSRMQVEPVQYMRCSEQPGHKNMGGHDCTFDMEEEFSGCPFPSAGMLHAQHTRSHTLVLKANSCFCPRLLTRRCRCAHQCMHVIASGV